MTTTTESHEPPRRRLVETTVCTIEERADGLIEVDLGHAVLRLDKARFASLAGTFQRVTREQLFAPRPAKPSPRTHLRLVPLDEAAGEVG